MTAEFLDLLHLFSCAVLSRTPDTERNYDFRNIYKLARRHQIQTIIFPVLEKYREELNIGNNVFTFWQNNYIFLVAKDAQRKAYMAELLNKLEKNDIRYCILKGGALAHLYRHAESRISSDVDLWVRDEENIETVLGFLADDGFTVEPIVSNSHQIECNHAEYGLIEVHTAVCDETAYKIWFENKMVFEEPFIKVSDDFGNEFYTLSVTDGAIYVTFHFLKHFLSHGCGCRQLMDMLLYLKHYENEINWDIFNNLFSDLRYLDFVNVCRQIGNLYFSMDFALDTEIDKALCDAALADMETSGVFGTGEEHRKYFTDFYTSKRKATGGTKENVSFGSKKQRVLSFIRSRKYNPFVIVKDLFAKNKNTKVNLQQINERLELFDKLGFFNGVKKK